MKLARAALVALSLASLAAPALATEAKKEAAPNCEVQGKKMAVKDKAACDAHKGKWLAPATQTTGSGATPAPATTEPGK